MSPTPSPVAPLPQEMIQRRVLAVVVALLLMFSTVLTAPGRERLLGWSQIVVQAFSAEPAQSVFQSRANDLTPQQGRAVRWIARRHRVSVVAVEQIVLAAYASAASHRLDPYLLLAVISVESSFNPLAESKVGAKGLMQVMPEVHRERFQRHGGTDAALNPWANIDVGAGILREYLDRFKTIEAALSAYVGMGPSGQTQYPSKVLRIRDQLHAAAQGRVLA